MSLLLSTFFVRSCTFIPLRADQERNEHEGKVAAIRSLQQWRLTDVELHNFINRCGGRPSAFPLPPLVYRHPYPPLHGWMLLHRSIFMMKLVTAARYIHIYIYRCINMYVHYMFFFLDMASAVRGPSRRLVGIAKHSHRISVESVNTQSNLHRHLQTGSVVLIDLLVFLCPECISS